MRASEAFAAVATFVVATLLVVGVTAGAGVVLDDGPSAAASQSDATAFDAGTLLPDPVSDDGTVPEPDAETEKTVVVDVSHGNDVSRTDVQPLVDALVRDGHEVRFFAGGSSGYGLSGSSGSSPLNETLRDADAFVVVNPATPYTDAEVDGIEAFAEAGGRVLLLADTPTRGSTATSVLPGISTGATASATGQPTNVAGRFGIAFGSGYLYDMTDNANNFQYVYGSPAGDDAVAAGADRTVLRKAVPVVANDEATTVFATEDARLSSTRKNGSYAVAARNGDVLAVGDTWFLSPEASTLADNERLVGNVASFLVGGDKEPGAPEAAAPATPSFGGVGGGATAGGGTSVPTPAPQPSEPSNETNTTSA
jgi:hypothetical protein